MSESLKNCPFCGGRATTTYVRDGRKAVCTSCYACGPAAFNGPAGKPSADDRAISSWNRRASQPASDTPDPRDEVIRRLSDLVRGLLENDPDDIIADGGVTVLDEWRKQACAALSKGEGAK